MGITIIAGGVIGGIAMQAYFKNEAQVYKRLEVAAISLKDNSKYVVPGGSNLVNVISEAAGIVPLPQQKDPKKQ